IHSTSMYANLTKSHELAGVLQPQAPWERRPIGPHAFATGQEFQSLRNISMGTPCHVPRHFRVVGVVLKDDLRIRKRRLSGKDPIRFPREFRDCHESISSRANGLALSLGASMPRRQLSVDRRRLQRLLDSSLPE